jgi:hypothetical protein
MSQYPFPDPLNAGVLAALEHEHKLKKMIDEATAVSSVAPTLKQLRQLEAENQASRAWAGEYAGRTATAQTLAGAHQPVPSDRGSDTAAQPDLARGRPIARWRRGSEATRAGGCTRRNNESAYARGDGQPSRVSSWTLDRGTRPDAADNRTGSALPGSASPATSKSNFVGLILLPAQSGRR